MIVNCFAPGLGQAVPYNILYAHLTTPETSQTAAMPSRLKRRTKKPRLALVCRSLGQLGLLLSFNWLLEDEALPGIVRVLILERKTWLSQEDGPSSLGPGRLRPLWPVTLPHVPGTSRMWTLTCNSTWAKRKGRSRQIWYGQANYYDLPTRNIGIPHSPY